MFAVVRRYSGVSTLMDEMEARQDEVESIIADVPGFNAYYAVRDGDALTTITVCDNQAGADKSTALAADWVRENLPTLTASPPEVAGGEVFLSFHS